MKGRKNIAVLTILSLGVLLASYAPAFAASDMTAGQAIVDRARTTLGDFMHDPNYDWFHKNLDHAKGVLIFPQVFKGAFIVGAAGGTGVFLVRDDKTGEWSQPAFYTIGEGSFGLQIGGEETQVVMLAMTQKAIDSLFSSSFKLGADASVAAGPMRTGATASMSVPNVNADFISFAKSKGLYAGLNFTGAVIAVRDSLNSVYYGKNVTPLDIIERNMVSNKGAAELRESLRQAAA